MMDSKIGLYRGARGNRGVFCTDDFGQGETLLIVPLRLAIADHADDEESNRLVYPGAPWSVRLACKLLREKAKARGGQ